MRTWLCVHAFNINKLENRHSKGSSRCVSFLLSSQNCTRQSVWRTGVVDIFVQVLPKTQLPGC